jgi:hypothetical protein
MGELTIMKKTLINFSLCFCFTITQAQSSSNLADSLRITGNYALELKYHLQAYYATPTNSENVYNMACCYALLQNADSAFYFLHKAIDLGRNDGWALADCDLYYLHKDARWRGIENGLKEIYSQKTFASDIELGWKLSKMYFTDQAPKNAQDNVMARYGIPSPQVDSISKLIAKTDSLNMLRLEEIFDKYGWTTRQLVGLEGANNAFIIILNAPLKYKKKYFEMIKIAVDSGDLKKRSIAFLTDKILTEEGKKQIYGTQLKYSYEKKIYEFKPIENESTVNYRRIEFGLGTIEDYAKDFGLEYKYAH